MFHTSASAHKVLSFLSFTVNIFSPCSGGLGSHCFKQPVQNNSLLLWFFRVLFLFLNNLAHKESAGGWTRWSLKVSSNPNHSVMLWNSGYCSQLRPFLCCCMGHKYIHCPLGKQNGNGDFLWWNYPWILLIFSFSPHFVGPSSVKNKKKGKFEF